MKVVLFCGGLGLRIRDAAPEIPKPMIPIGDRPILLQIMNYYAHFGHTDFVLCLGYKAQVIKDFFAALDGGLFVGSDDRDGRSSGTVMVDDRVWNITFADTGLHSSIGERLLSVRECIGDDEVFLANYSDVLTDVHLPDMIENLARQEKVASFECVRPTYTFHVVSFGPDGQSVAGVHDIRGSDMWINGGYFVFRREIFDYLRPGEDLVDAAFDRLIRDKQLVAYRHGGFWVAMDTFKDRQHIQELYAAGRRPWAVWETPAGVISPVLATQ